MLTSKDSRRSILPHLFTMLVCAGISANLRAQTAPTSSDSAQHIDQQWVEASSKYDATRNKVLQHVDSVGAQGPFTPDWKTLANYTAPDWYRDAKFGIFIHWGVYSVPAFYSEWYPREMYIEGSAVNKHHIETYGPLTKFGYKDFIPMFKAEKFDPQAWAQLFADAGAKYVVPVFEHHDGFAMYDSSLSDWTAVKMGPKRDLAGDLAKAIRARGMHLGASSHRVEHDWFFDGGRKTASDVNDPKNAGLYGPAQARFEDGNDAMIRDFTYASPAYLNDWLARTAEIVEKYHPDLMYFDWWIGQPSVRPYLARFAAFYYDESRRNGTLGVINYKFDAMQENSGTLDLERGQLDATRTLPWQTDTSVGNRSWGYIEHDVYKTPREIVHQLIDIVSKNGNLLMNIGPRADGTIPDEVRQALLGVGAWLKVNGEAIYGTRPWKLFGEGPTKVVGGSFNDTRSSQFTAQDFRFTSKGGVLYAIELGWPADGQAVIHALGFDQLGVPAKIHSVTLLGSTEAVAFEQKRDGLYLHLPGQAPTPDASSFRIEFEPPAGGTR
jgi:alpha-L-fucosidase